MAPNIVESINKTAVELLIEKIKILEIKHKNRALNAEIEKIMKTENDFLMRLLNLLSTIYFVVITCFTTSPMLLMVVNYLKTREFELILPIITDYPFDPYNFRVYPWMYLYQFWTMCLLCLYLTSADFMFCIFCTHLCTQFRILACYAKELIPVDYNHRTYINQGQLKLDLIEIIKWHQELLRCTEVLESVYTKSTLCNFIISSILICLGGFNVVATETIFSKFLTFLLMSLVQVFIPCLFGDLLKEASLAVADGVYNSKWYLVDVSIAKVLLMVLTKSQSPCILTAWGYADVNLRAFIKIGSTAWSYFALLQTIYSVQNQEE